MSTIILRTQADVCAAILAFELNDEYSGTPIVENVRIDDGVNVSISYDIAPNAAQLIQLDDVLAAHDCSTLNDEDTAGDSIGSIFHVTFMNESTTKNKWLEYMEDNSSDEVPFVVPFNVKLVAITFSNENYNKDTDIRIYSAEVGSGSSNSLVHTWSIRDARVAGKTVFNPEITFDAGDKIAVYLKDAGSDPKSPMVVLYFEKTNEVTGDFQENFSGDF